MTTETTTTSTVLLIAGHWLGAWAWDEVLEHLAAAGSPATALTLPGTDGNDPLRRSTTIDDQAAAIVDAVGRGDTGHGVMLVAHSGANAPVTVAIDRDPGRVRRVIWIDSGPVADGSVSAPDAPADLTEVPLPPFSVLGAQASLDGLDAGDLDRFRSRAVPVPGPVVRGAVRLTDDARFGIPTTMVCCSMSSPQVIRLVRTGHPMFAEVARFTDHEFIDLPTGHWPMWSRPADLAQVIGSVVSRDD